MDNIKDKEAESVKESETTAEPKDISPGDTEEKQNSKEVQANASDFLEKFNALNDKHEKLLEAYEKLEARAKKDQDKRFEELNNKYEELTNKVGRNLTPNVVKGYYNYNHETQKFVNEEAQARHDRAKQIWDALGI